MVRYTQSSFFADETDFLQSVVQNPLVTPSGAVSVSMEQMKHLKTMTGDKQNEHLKVKNSETRLKFSFPFQKPDTMFQLNRSGIPLVSKTLTLCLIEYLSYFKIQ